MRSTVAVRILATVLAASVCARHGVAQPDEEHAQVVQADYLISLKWPVAARPIRLRNEEAETILLVRYWVTPETVRLEVLWAEPLWGPTVFPDYAPGTMVTARDETLFVGNSYRRTGTTVSLPPDLPRSAGTMPQPWKLDHFASWWQRELDTRDLAISERRQVPFPVNGVQSGSREIVLDSKESDRLLKLQSTAGPLSWTTVIENTWSTDSNTGRLVQQHVTLSEEPVVRRLDDAAAPGVPKEIRLSRRKYGRQVDIEWARPLEPQHQVAVPGQIVVTVPASPQTAVGPPARYFERHFDKHGRLIARRDVETNLQRRVYDDLDDGILRSARLIGSVRVIPGDDADLSSPSPLASGWLAEEFAWKKQVSARYWGGRLELTPAERESAWKLYEQYMKASSVREGIAYRLREDYASALMALILQDQTMLRETLARYRERVRELGGPAFLSVWEDALRKLCSRWKGCDIAGVLDEADE